MAEGDSRDSRRDEDGEVEDSVVEVVASSSPFSEKHLSEMPGKAELLPSHTQL